MNPKNLVEYLLLLYAEVAELGIRDGLKIRWWQHLAGSNPALGTILRYAKHKLADVAELVDAQP